MEPKKIQVSGAVQIEYVNNWRDSE